MAEYPLVRNEIKPKKIESLYQGRIRQFTDRGQYAHLNLPNWYDIERFGGKDRVQLQVYSVPDLKRPLFKKAIEDAEWRDVDIGANLSPSWSTHWFKIKVKPPKTWPHPEIEGTPVFEFDSSDEGLLYSEDGVPLVALSAEHQRREWILPSKWLDDEWHTFYIETACNNISGNGSPPNMNRTFRLNMADLVLPNAAARALYIDYWILGDAGRELAENSWRKHKAQDLLNRIINVFDNDNGLKAATESIIAGRKIAKEMLGDVDSPKVYDSKENIDVFSMGNCHIDTAWLWPFAETRRKIVRSWTTQLDLLERYEEYKFAASQAVQFQWLLEDHPDVFKRVQAAAKKGNFIPIGGAWVECDTNMPSGESLTRQTLLGQMFFKEHFDATSEVFWLPDTFGYSPQLPQICRNAGMPYFITQKMSWNNINKFPLSTFNWVGIDGSQVLTHMPPADTYTAQAHFGDVNRSIQQHKNLDTSQQGLLLYGHGDGGGGPTTEMLEKLRRCRGFSNTSGGDFPKLDVGQTVDDFFRKIKESTDNGNSLPSWVGELYLEYHRGTYTTQATIKRYMRRCEILLHDIEKVSTLAACQTGYSYPQDQLTELWRDVCLCQFHDVLPGSGIEMIYVDARKILEDVLKNGKHLLAKGFKALGYELSDSSDAVPVNLLPWKPSLHREQSFNNIEKGFLDFSNKPKSESNNNHLSAKFKNGELTGLKDLRNNRKVLSGPIRFKLFEDQPLNFPAWDTEVYATEKFDTLEPSSSSDSKTIYEFGKSKMSVSITEKSDHIQYDVEVDWHETYKFLKVEVPVNVRSHSASYECAYGVHQRPTHFNTTWEAAKFEVCGHKYADLSDSNYGVAILNDCKYGYSIHGNIMRLSLLRAPKSPDANADMGHHKFSFAIYPHLGALTAEVVRAAYEFNYASYLVEESEKPMELDAFKISDADNVILTAVKWAEQSKHKKSVVLRCYEALGAVTRFKFTSKFKVLRAFQIDSLESKLQSFEVVEEDGTYSIAINAEGFEVVSVLLELA